MKHKRPTTEERDAELIALAGPWYLTSIYRGKDLGYVLHLRPTTGRGKWDTVLRSARRALNRIRQEVIRGER